MPEVGEPAERVHAHLVVAGVLDRVLEVLERGDLVVLVGELTGAEPEHRPVLVVEVSFQFVSEHPLGPSDVAGVVPQLGRLDDTSDPIGVGLGRDGDCELGEVGRGGDSATPACERNRLGELACNELVRALGGQPDVVSSLDRISHRGGQATMNLAARGRGGSRVAHGHEQRMGEPHVADPALDHVRGNRLGQGITDVVVNGGEKVACRCGQRRRGEEHALRGR